MSGPLLHTLSLGADDAHKPALILLHGLYGYGRNWQSLARKLSARYRVYLPDLRNHGQSFHSDEWTYQAMAADLARLASSLGLERFALLGHSMGGKVAMQYALTHGQERLSHLVIVDIAPKPYRPDYHRGLLTALSGLDLAGITSRAQADQALTASIPETGVRSFLLSNLERVPEPADGAPGWRWQFNLPVLRDRLELITENLTIDDGSAFTACPVLFLAGEKSDYVRPDDLPAIQALFPQAACEWIPDAGHWVHVDQPDALQARLEAFLAS